jgi:sterol desaturase/sphingolipid hydroxylase (fatty acid hydroxylase superfamily)
MYYTAFLGTFSLTSFACSIVDFFYPHYRIKQEEERIITGDYLKMAPLVSFNLLLAYPVFKGAEFYIDNREPSEINPILYFQLWLLIADLTFYSIHYAFHHPKLYEKYHSVHHQFKYTYGMGAIYAHPYDFLFANILPTFCPILICTPSSNMVYFIIIFATTFTVVVSHGGHKFFDNAHLKHHLMFRKNYGLFISDKIMGTTC